MPIQLPGTNTVELILADKNTPPMTLDTKDNFVTPSLPTLSVSQSAGKVIISWPVSTTSAVLQETSALPGGWTDSAAPITVQGSLNVAAIPPTGKSTFYRLSQ